MQGTENLSDTYGIMPFTTRMPAATLQLPIYVSSPDGAVFRNPHFWWIHSTREPMVGMGKQTLASRQTTTQPPPEVLHRFWGNVLRHTGIAGPNAALIAFPASSKSYDFQGDSGVLHANLPVQKMRGWVEGHGPWIWLRRPDHPPLQQQAFLAALPHKLGPLHPVIPF